MIESAIAVLVLFLFLLAIWAVEEDRKTRRQALLKGIVKPALQDQQAKNTMTKTNSPAEFERITSADYQEIQAAIMDACGQWEADHNVHEDLNAHQYQYFGKYECHIAQEYIDNVNDNTYKLSDAKEWFIAALESELEIVKLISDTALEARWKRKGLD